MWYKNKKFNWWARGLIVAYIVLIIIRLQGGQVDETLCWIVVALSWSVYALQLQKKLQKEDNENE